MNKEEILQKSRAENKDRDLYSLEVNTDAGNIGSLTSLAVATIFFITERLTAGTFNYGLYAILLSVGAANLIYRTIRLKRRRDLIVSVIYTAAALILSVVHMYRLISVVL